MGMTFCPGGIKFDTIFPTFILKYKECGMAMEILLKNRGRCADPMQEIKNLNSDKIAFIKHMYEWTQQITHFADMKVSALQIINTLIISFSATFSIKDLSPISKMVVISAVVLAVFSSLMLLMTILPRMSKGTSAGINFYSGVLKYSHEEYLSKMAAIDLDELLNSYIDSLYAVALIQEKKFFRLRVGVLSSFFAIALVGATIVLNVLFYHR